MHALTNSLQRRVRLSLALIAILLLSAGCRMEMMTGSVASAGSPEGVGRAAESNTLVVPADPEGGGIDGSITDGGGRQGRHLALGHTPSRGPRKPKSR